MYVRRHSACQHYSCVLDGPQNELCDSSGPLFSLYSKIVEGGDNKSAKCHQKDAEGIVLFVSPILVYASLSTSTKNKR